MISSVYIKVYNKTFLQFKKIFPQAVGGPATIWPDWCFNKNPLKNSKFYGERPIIDTKFNNNSKRIFYPFSFIILRSKTVVKTKEK